MVSILAAGTRISGGAVITRKSCSVTLRTPPWKYVPQLFLFSINLRLGSNGSTARRSGQRSTFLDERRAAGAKIRCHANVFHPLVWTIGSWVQQLPQSPRFP